MATKTLQQKGSVDRLSGPTCVSGQLTRAGGKDKPIFELLQPDGKRLVIDASIDQLLQINPRLHQNVSIEGQGRWAPDSLELVAFRFQRFDDETPKPEPAAPPPATVVPKVNPNELMLEKHANRILLELPDRSQAMRVEVEHNGDRLIIMYAPSSGELPVQIEYDLSPTERVVLGIVVDARRKITRSAIRAEMFRRDHQINSSHLGALLSGLMIGGYIKNDHDHKGYYV